MALAIHVEALQVNVWIFNDGAHNDLWALALDEQDKRLTTMVDKNSFSQNELVVSSGSLGSRSQNYSAVLINSIRLVDEANAERHHFDVVHLRSQPLRQVVGIGKNTKLRRLAYMVALTCRDRFEMQMQRISSTDTAPKQNKSFTCPSSHNYEGIEFLVQYFKLDSPEHELLSSSSEPALQGVWAPPTHPAEENPMQPAAEDYHPQPTTNDSLKEYSPQKGRNKIS